MLTSINDLPPNSQTPLPADFFQSDGDLYSLYAQAITAKSASQCIPGPESFAALAPAGAPVPQISRNAQHPALSSAVSAPSPVSPLASQVAITQQRLHDMLVNRSQALTDAVNDVGGQGAVNPPDAFADAAEVLPMGTTENVIAERGTPRSGVTVSPRTPYVAGTLDPYGRPIQNRRSAPVTPRIPAPQWGGAPVSATPGTCNASSELSGWAKLFLAAGVGIAVLAAFNQR